MFDYAFSNFAIEAMKLGFNYTGFFANRTEQYHEVHRLTDHGPHATRSLHNFLQSTIVCRQIRAETVPLPFRNNVIRLDDIDSAALLLSEMSPSQQDSVAWLQLLMHESACDD
jgi:hypothetical protein